MTDTRSIEGVDYHWGADPAHGGLTKHVGARSVCSGLDCRRLFDIIRDESVQADSYCKAAADAVQVEVVAPLLAEVEQLRAGLADAERERDDHKRTIDYYGAQSNRYRAEIVDTRKQAQRAEDARIRMALDTADAFNLMRSERDSARRERDESMSKLDEARRMVEDNNTLLIKVQREKNAELKRLRVELAEADARNAATVNTAFDDREDLLTQIATKDAELAKAESDWNGLVHNHRQVLDAGVKLLAQRDRAADDLDALPGTYTVGPSNALHVLGLVYADIARISDALRGKEAAMPNGNHTIGNRCGHCSESGHSTAQCPNKES